MLDLILFFTDYSLCKSHKTKISFHVHFLIFFSPFFSLTFFVTFLCKPIIGSRSELLIQFRVWQHCFAYFYFFSTCGRVDSVLYASREGAAVRGSVGAVQRPQDRRGVCILHRQRLYRAQVLRAIIEQNVPFRSWVWCYYYQLTRDMKVYTVCGKCNSYH